MANRDLLKEAIADAKAVKETAIANAKAALEEAFAPRMKEMLAAKLAEIDEADETNEEVTEVKEKDLEENYDMEEAKEMDEMKHDMDEAEKMDEVDLEELLRELESMDEGEDEMKEDLNEEEEGLLNDPKTPTAHGNVAEEEKDEEVKASEDEEIDIENMDEDDLKSFIESVIADMVAAGELEGNIEAKDEDEKMGGEEEVKASEEEKVEVKEGDDDCPSGVYYGDQCLDESKVKAENMKKKMEEMKKELDEAYSALETIKSELNEVNLFNAKLLYTNKIFKAKNLTESQKVKVLAAFDKAASVKEAKLVFETLSEGFKEKKSPVNESLLRGSASKPAGVSEKKPIMEVNDQFARWQKLAGIK